MFRRPLRAHEIAPDEIFLDSTNLPGVDADQFEGRIARPVSRRSLIGVGIVFSLVIIAFGGRAVDLQVARGATYAAISRDNTLTSWPLFATRGLIYDRSGTPLAWNEAQTNATSSATTTPYALRRYIDLPGFSVLLGFVRYPKQDAGGSWWRESYTGMAGIEQAFEGALAGENGSVMVETDAHLKAVQQNIETPPTPGRDLHLSVDADVQSHLYKFLWQHAQDQGFVGGAAIIMDVETGQILAMTSFPEYSDQGFTDGDPQQIAAASGSGAAPMLDRAIAGLYAPGSIVKPIFAAAALNENLISPDKTIVSTGAISVPNPYDPGHPSLFHDWTVHGPIDMRTAIAVSSDEYFYTIGGGYAGQPGLGIGRIDTYAALFGLGQKTGIALSGEKAGVVPSIAWKAIAFPEDPAWRIGDTYHTAIGQYGFQITPIQAVRYVAAIANGGKLLTPQLFASSTAEYRSIGIPDADLEVVREGMRLGVTSQRSDAIEKFFNMSGIELAGKTGTAQIGAHNQWINSWSVGFWPASHPRYAFAAVLERAPAGTPSGAAPGMLPFFQWLISAHPEYVN